MSSKRRLARAQERRDRIKKLAKKCVCGKTLAGSTKEAWELALAHHKTHGGELPKRVYRCDKNPKAFHWTRMEQVPDSLQPLPESTTPKPDIYSEEYWKS